MTSVKTKGKVENSKEPVLNISAMDLSHHAIERSMQRFEFNGESDAIKKMKNNLKNAKYIGIVSDEDFSQDCHLYHYKKIAIYVSLNLKEIVTVYHRTALSHEDLRSKVSAMYEKEFRKLDRKETATKRKLHIAELEAKSEIAALELRRFKTRSKNVKKECVQRIKDIEKGIKDLHNEIKAIQTEKRQVAKGLVAIG